MSDEQNERLHTSGGTQSQPDSQHSGAEHVTAPGLAEALQRREHLTPMSRHQRLRLLGVWWSRRWMTVSIVTILAVVGYLLASTSTEGQRNQHQIDKVRIPLCSIIYTALSHAPATQAQASVRGDYLKAYGPDGLRCPKPLPPVLAQ